MEHRKAYLQYGTLMEKLDELIAKGAIDSKEADSLRDKMDPIWIQMTSDEQAEFNTEVKDLRSNLRHPMRKAQVR